MSVLIDTAIERLQARLGRFDEGTAKFVMPGAGAIMLDPRGIRAGDDQAEVTLTATPEVFRAILEGEMNATSAFMSGKLAIDGSMGLAMKLGAALS